MNKPRNTSKAIRTKTSIAILITAAVLMLLISGIQQYYSRNQTRADLERNAEMEMVIKANEKIVECQTYVPFILPYPYLG